MVSTLKAKMRAKKRKATEEVPNKKKVTLVEEPKEPTPDVEEVIEEEGPTWDELCNQEKIERRISKAISDLGWASPTLVQRAAIPVAMTRRDMLIQARTGSGKTACYAVPVLARILEYKQAVLVRGGDEIHVGVLAVVLAPTRELVAQARRQLLSVAAYCRDQVDAVALMGESPSSDAATVRTRADVVVATPAAFREACDKADAPTHPLARLSETLLALVVDEADLVLSFGYEDDVDHVVEVLQGNHQTLVMSATLGEDATGLKTKFRLKRPATVRLKEAAGIFGGDRDDEAFLAQYFIPVKKDDRLLVTYVLLKLGVLDGRGILFVNDVDACYRLKLFLDLFAIRCLVLNAELPLASRLHAIESYNRGYFDLLVATDAAVSSQNDSFGVARGIDFKNVSWVLNVDFPTSVSAYTHRVGRTARAGARGTALSLVAGDDETALHLVQDDQPPVRLAALASGGACAVVASIGTPENDALVKQPVQLAFDTATCEPFRYRVDDIKRGVTRVAVREARAAELRRELLNSKQLQAHFEANPDDFAVLKYDRDQVYVRRDLVADNVKTIPSYLVPTALRAVGAEPKASFKRKKTHRSGARNNSTAARKDNDPLQSFDAAGVPDKTQQQQQPKIYSPNDPELGRHEPTSNRNKWKQLHRKGQWAKHKKPAHSSGRFTTSRTKKT